MIQLDFDGWFQCRLATNPDPTDERRGVSGYTFAVAGEPDLDRVIRLHHPKAPRSHAPEIGVFVRAVFADGEEVPDHPLRGAAIDLLDEPKFESRNLLLTDDRGGTGLIHPFVLEIRQSASSLRRQDPLVPGQPDLPLHEAPRDRLNRRAPLQLDGMTLDPLRVADATGVRSPEAHRRRRQELLQQDLAATEDETERAALAKRIRELEIRDPRNVRVVMATVVQSFGFEIGGPVELDDDAGLFPPRLDRERDWPIEFWLGGWDADGLCGFMRGRLGLPLLE